MAGTITFFADGEAYERFLGCWSRLAGEVFIDWLALPSGLNWVDVGCGTGALTELIAERCAPGRICALDSAEDQIVYAQHRGAVVRTEFRVGDAQAMPYADGEFDVAAMGLVIVFFPDPTKAVSEMKRVVKGGGTVATYIFDTFGGGFTQRHLEDALAAMNVNVPTLPGDANTRLDTMKGFFEVAGLAQVRTRTIDIEVSYASFDDYWAAQTALPNPPVQMVRKMAKPDVERLKAHLRGRLPTDRNGRIVYPARVNAVKGRVPD